MSPRKHVEFFVNGQLQKVTDEFPLTTTLNSYLRYTLNLTGTKIFCNEGGCGCCVINAQVYDKTLGKLKDFSVNSCLFPLYSCDGYSFTTVEGITTSANGIHPISKRLADANGSQCGYCSSGFVMSMYSLLKSNSKPAKKDVESSFDGNICRCTGYRSILDAMRSFSADEKPIDIEDLNCLKCLKVDEHNDGHSCSTVALTNENKHWFAPSSIDELDSLLKTFDSIRFVSGNTSVGIYKNEDQPKVYVNLKNLAQLSQVDIKADQLVIGSTVTISNLIQILSDAAVKFPNNYGHVQPSIVGNLLRVGNVHVRNVATWSGNMALKRRHPAFPSDVLIALETLNAALNIKLYDKQGQSTMIKMTLSEFITSEILNGSNFLILSMIVPAFEQNYIRIKTYKVSPRAQNSHSYINAGFRITIDASNIIKSASIVLNGISERFFHANETENFLTGKNFTDGAVFKKAVETLREELEKTATDQVNDPLVASFQYRQTVALSLFYKFFLAINGDKIGKRLENSSEVLFDWRTLSKGEQTYSSKEELYPLTKPMPKLNALLQTSGQTKYMDDLTPSVNQLNGAFILSTVANATIEKIDVDEALAIPGVLKILFYQDIPGKNNIMFEPFQDECLFAEKHVFHAGQPIGLVVAKTYQQAKRASKLVKVDYGDLKKPILTFEQAFEANSYHPDPLPPLIKGDAPLAIQQSKHQISGEFNFGASQFNFYLEGIVGICKPTEDGYSIECSTQWLDCVQRGVANVLGLENSSNIDVKLRQMGGSFGGKATRGNFAAAAAALAASHLKVPVKVYMDLNDCMDMIGKRPPWNAKYQVGFDDDGKINGISYEWYADPGMTTNGCHVIYSYPHFDSAYNSPAYLVKPKIVKTNKPTSAEVRGPDLFAAVCVTEQVLEHIAYDLRKDPLQVREINLFKKDDITAAGHKLTYIDICRLVDQLKTSCDYVKRKEEIENFNRQNRYKKKGISLIPLRYGMTYKLGYYNALVSVRHYDGAVSISHGGVEMGQGIHTKAAQVCAHELGIPIEKISIKSTNNLVNPNCLWTGGSVTFELVSKSIIGCCEILKKRLEPVRGLLKEGYTWNELVEKAFSMNINLSAMYLQREKDLNFNDFTTYDVDSAACSEVIIDVLTGENQIIRTDILYDAGQSMNGMIDIGQAEGAFVMGLGAICLEKSIYDPETGQCLNHGTWEYKPPEVNDIPVDFRVKFVENKPNPVGVLGSKTAGEPPLFLSNSILFAIKHAIASARQDRGHTGYFKFDIPATVDAIQQACLVDPSEFSILN